jgi:hypothetical protein
MDIRFVSVCFSYVSFMFYVVSVALYLVKFYICFYLFYDKIKRMTWQATSLGALSFRLCFVYIFFILSYVVLCYSSYQ